MANYEGLLGRGLKIGPPYRAHVLMRAPWWRFWAREKLGGHRVYKAHYWARDIVDESGRVCATVGTMK